MNLRADSQNYSYHDIHSVFDKSFKQGQASSNNQGLKKINFILFKTKGLLIIA